MLRFGFMDIPSDPCVLIWGGRDDLLGFAKLLREAPSLADGSSLAELGGHAQTGETVLLMPCETAARGLMRDAEDEKTFRWELDPALSARFADMVEALAGASEGHQYLETEWIGQTTVRVSTGEYPDDFLTEGSNA